MRVKAKSLGYYGHRRRKEGEIFDLAKKEHFSAKWMLELKKGGKVTKAAEPEEVDEDAEELGDADDGDVI